MSRFRVLSHAVNASVDRIADVSAAIQTRPKIRPDCPVAVPSLRYHVGETFDGSQGPDVSD